jgi:hypothetical protein
MVYAHELFLVPMTNPNRDGIPHTEKKNHGTNWLSVKQSQKPSYRVDLGYAMDLPCQNHRYLVVHLIKIARCVVQEPPRQLSHEAPHKGAIGGARDTPNKTSNE